ncbi:MAG: Verru_Chthon cassette protein B [Chthoniobacteraceae bacterium]
MDKSRFSPAGNSTTGGFSLVEVAMAIGIVSFAFVALFALMPTGLQTFRESIDTQSETWIAESLNSMVQTSEWEKVYNPSGDGLTDDIYYFDEEARLTDTKKNASSDPDVVRRRLYAVRLFSVPLERSMATGGTEIFTRNETAPVAVKVIAVIARLEDAKSMEELNSMTDQGVTGNLGKDSHVRIVAFVATQMNADRRS